MSEAQILLVTAASIAFAHTLLGPDHYLVFAALGKARNWTLGKTLRITLLCGVGHVLGSIAIGGVGLLIGAELFQLVSIEGFRGDMAGWALLFFGLLYFVWGMKQSFRRQEHNHLHAHGDIVHSHVHDHQREHAHPHPSSNKGNVSTWAMFVIFVLGPCEALIPLFMYPAAKHNAGLVISVAFVFGLVTLFTMLAAVALTTLGLQRIKLPSLDRHSHAIAGGSIAACGAAITFLSI